MFFWQRMQKMPHDQCRGNAHKVFWQWWAPTGAVFSQAVPLDVSCIGALNWLEPAPAYAADIRLQVGFMFCLHTGKYCMPAH